MFNKFWRLWLWFFTRSESRLWGFYLTWASAWSALGSGGPVIWLVNVHGWKRTERSYVGVSKDTFSASRLVLWRSSWSPFVLPMEVPQTAEVRVAQLAVVLSWYKPPTPTELPGCAGCKPLAVLPDVCLPRMQLLGKLPLSPCRWMLTLMVGDYCSAEQK